MVRKTSARQTFINILNIRCDLELLHSNQIFSQNTPAYDVTIKLSLVAKHPQFRRYCRNRHTLIIQALSVTLTFKLAHQSFCLTLGLMMMHHHTKFDYKRSHGSEDIRWTDIHWPLNLRRDLYLEHGQPIFSRDTQAYNDVPASYVSLQKDHQFKRYNRNSHILII